MRFEQNYHFEKTIASARGRTYSDVIERRHKQPLLFLPDDFLFLFFSFFKLSRSWISNALVLIT